MTEDLIIRIRQEIDNKGLKTLKGDLTSVQKEMDTLVSTGQRNSNTYKDLSKLAGELTGKISVLKKEYIGLNAEMNKPQKEIKGKTTNIGEVGSKQYWTEYKKGFTDLMNSVSQGSPKWNEYKAGVDRAQHALNGFKATKKATIFQMMEFGENLTVVGAGLLGIANQVGRVVSELLKLGSSLMTVKAAFNDFSGGQGAGNLDLLRTASSGNMTDEKLMQYANRYMALGYSIQQVAQVLDFSEKAGDKFGIQMEESTEKVLRFLQTGKGRGFEQMGVDINKVNEEAYKLAGGTKQMFEALDEEQQTIIRTTAFLNLYGDSIDNITVKQKGLDDKVVSSQTNWENLKAKLGEFIAQGVEPTLTAYGKFMDMLSGGESILEKVSGGMVSMSDAAKLIFSPLTGLIEFAGRLWNVLKNIHNESTAFRESIGSLFKALSANPSSNLLGSIADVVLFVNDKIKEMLALLNLIPGVDISFTGKKEAKGGTPFKEAKGGTLDKGTGSRSGTDSTKEQVDLFRELIDQIRTQASLYQITNGLEGESYDILLKKLEVNKELADTDQKRVEYYTEVLNLSNKIKDVLVGRLTLSAESLKNSGMINEEIPMKEEQPLIQRQETMNERIDKHFSNYLYLSEQTESVFRNMMSTLGIEADTFVGKMVNGFNTVLSIIQLMTQVKGFIDTVLTFIPGGGAMAGASLRGISGSSGVSRSISNYVRSSTYSGAEPNFYVATMDGIKFYKTSKARYDSLKRSKTLP